MLTSSVDQIHSSAVKETFSPRLWMPKRVVFTAKALDEPFGQKILERVRSFDLPVEIAANNRITGLQGATVRETYKIAKSTLAIVTAPPSAFRLQPIPPSADFQFHLAEGCPAHCQYCYLAGSLQGPPAIRVFANLPSILNNTISYQKPGVTTSFEASCYTDPLSIEHLTGSLAETIQFFGTQPNAHLRFVTKFTAIEPLLNIDHKGRTRWRVSLNAPVVSRRFEGGTASVDDRIAALSKLALPVEQGGGSYPIGVVLAPIMPVEGWQTAYRDMLVKLRQTLSFPTDLTFELITHRFTPGSKKVLTEWYPNTSLQMDEELRSSKTNKFGGTKYVYDKQTMDEMKRFFYAEIAELFPQAKVLYWT